MSFDSVFRSGGLLLARRGTPAPASSTPLPALFACARLRDLACSGFSQGRLIELAEWMGDDSSRFGSLNILEYRDRVERTLICVERALENGALLAFEVVPTRFVSPAGLDVPESKPSEPMPGIKEPAPDDNRLDAGRDVAAQADTLGRAAASGTPFCEECEKKQQPKRNAA